YAVLMPDPALSTGYGQKMIDRGWADWGPRTMADLEAILDAALTTADLDGERTAAIGGSFGGYLANWVAGHTDRLRANLTPARHRELRRALPAPVPGQDHHPDARHPRRQGLPGADRGGAAPLVGPAAHRRRVEVPVLPGREPLDPQAGQRRRLVRDGPGLPRPPRAGPGVEAAGVGGLMAETMTPEGFLRLAEDIAREAGDMLVAKRPAMSTRSADIETKSSPTDVVTVLDLASEQLIRERILAARPGDRILGEEEGDRPGETDVRWVADPIDGTVNFLYGLPDWAVSIAVEVRGRIVAGVVNAAARGEVYTASEGGGAWLAGERLRCNPAA